MNPFGQRTKQALAWMQEVPGRTQVEAAAKFGISQPTIAGALARERSRCSACGQRLKPGVVERQPAAPAVDASVLARGVLSFAWHSQDCHAWESGDAEACTCGFTDVERAAKELVG